MSTTYARESLTISTVAKPLTASVYNALRPWASLSVTIGVEGANIRYDFATPSATTSLLLVNGAILSLEGIDDIQNIQFIRDNAASGDATISVIYINKIS